jgi:hypothetical protein
MAKKSVKRARTTKPKKRAAAKRSGSAGARERAEKRAFTDTLIATGQAACLDAQGKLPAGATHRIVPDERGKPTVVRRRFSAY